jgi:uncharacterized DUF497 family protein
LCSPTRSRWLNKIELTGEYRWRAIGVVGGIAVLLVAHIYVDHEDGDETIRIISARAATSGERRLYEQQRHDDR